MTTTRTTTRQMKASKPRKKTRHYRTMIPLPAYRLLLLLLLSAITHSSASSSYTFADHGTLATSRPDGDSEEDDHSIRSKEWWNESCRPRQIHLAVGGGGGTGGAEKEKETAAISTTTSSMRVSFAVTTRCRPTPSISTEIRVVADRSHHVRLDQEEGRVHRPTIDDVRTQERIVTVAMIEDWKAYTYVKPDHDDDDMYVSDDFYHVLVKGLQPDTQYRYRIEVELTPKKEEETQSSAVVAEDKNTTVIASPRHRRDEMVSDYSNLAHWGGNNNDNNKKQVIRSNLGTFTTPPLPGATPSSETPLQFAFVGDVGTSEAGQSTLNHMSNLHQTSSSHRFHSIMLVGDVSYANGHQHVWDTWMDMVQPLAMNCPLQVTPGNHEIEVDGRKGEIFVPYDARFVMPQVAPAYKLPSKDAEIHHGLDLVYEYGNAYYSYTYGTVRFIILSSFSVSSRGSTQYRWLHQELQSLDREVTPWVIVCFHVPMYNTFEAHHHSTAADEMKSSMEQLFGLYHVSIIFSGHVHAYSRSHPVLHDEVNKRGPTHVIIGDGGQGEGCKFSDPDTPEPWVAKRDERTHGFGILQVANATHARWAWIKNVPDAHFSLVHDDVYIENAYFVPSSM